MPSYLVPSDLGRLAKRFGCNPLELAKSHLLASPGAEILKDGKLYRLPTLVPARNDNGQCKFLVDSQCAIHAESPFGCAFFDFDMPDLEADRRAMAGLQALWDVWHGGDESGYSVLWEILYLSGRNAPDPRECKARIKKALET